MGKKISRILKGQIVTSVFFILFGFCLVLMPVGTVNLLCKVVFGLALVGAGFYHVYIYVREKENSTILDLFSGVIVLVLGGFLFTNPQIVVKLLPTLLGAFVLVDSIWILQGAFRLKKRENNFWKAFLISGLVFIGLGIWEVVWPFKTVRNMVMFAGGVFLANGILDVVSYILLKKGLKDAIKPEEEPAPAQKDQEKKEKKEHKLFHKKKKAPAEDIVVQKPDGAAPVKAKEEAPWEPVPVKEKEEVAQDSVPVKAKEEVPWEPVPEKAKEEAPWEPAPVKAEEEASEELSPVKAEEEVLRQPVPVLTLEPGSEISPEAPDKKEEQSDDIWKLSPEEQEILEEWKD